MQQRTTSEWKGWNSALQSLRVDTGEGQSRRSEGLGDIFRAHQHRGFIGELRYGVSILDADGQGSRMPPDPPPKSIPNWLLPRTGTWSSHSAQHQMPSKSRTHHSLHLHLNLNPHAVHHQHTSHAHPVPSEQPQAQGHPKSHSTSMLCAAPHHQSQQRETVPHPAAIDWQFGSVINP